MNCIRLCFTLSTAKRALIGATLMCIVAIAITPAPSVAQVEIVPGPTLTLTPAAYPTSNSVIYVPGLYTWYSNFGITSTKWNAGETVTFHLHGPLNTLGISPADQVIGHATADSSGALGQWVSTSGSSSIGTSNLELIGGYPNDPYSLAFLVREGDVVRPGNYTLSAVGNRTGDVDFPDSASVTINICPDTASHQFYDYIFNNPSAHFGWPQYRGGRDGFLGENSPERGDPEWPSVWSETPVALYATIAATDALQGVTDPPGNQPSFISHQDLPSTHYGHDVNMELLPDPDYLWILGTDNYFTKPGVANFGRIECEWETQNAGNPYTYGTGDIGMPIFVMPTPGDRVYMVGRWVMDNGHPDSGDRTEIHPPRLLATMRKQNTAVPFPGTGAMTRASQVDIFVSGHGGGSNQIPDGLSEDTDRNGEGGGIIQDIYDYPGLSLANLKTYFSSGPASGLILDTFLGAYQLFNGDENVQAAAGPSALGWTAGPEDRPINDMDYDFDVPLPVAPPGATTPHVLIIIHPTDTPTTVQEQITYTNPNPYTGLPTTAHIHLPYKGADNGIYAKTLEFYWDAFSLPGEHFQVQLNQIVFFLADKWSGKCQMWADVCGQWQYLTAVDPQGFLNAGVTQHGLLYNSPPIDVYLDPTDKLRVFTMGYDQEAFDNYFGVILGEPADQPLTSYQAGLPLAVLTEEYVALQKIDSNYSAENINLGGAVFEGNPSTQSGGGTVGENIIFSDTGRFYEDFTVKSIPTPPQLQVFGAPANFGAVCLGESGYQDVSVTNQGGSPLTVTGVSVTGGGYSVIPGLPVPFTVAGGADIDLNVYFRPTQISQGAGTLTILSSDPLHPSVTYNLSGTVNHATIQASANTLRTPTLVVGAITTWPVTITNPGTCPLSVTPHISGTGFSLDLTNAGSRIAFSNIVPPGGTTYLTVKFTTPGVASKFAGTLTLNSNDPVTPTTTLVFGAEGVPVGMRVLVVGADGTPFPKVDEIKLKRDRDPKLNVHLKDVRLTTIDPPASWQRIQYDYMTALSPTQGGADSYTLRVQVGNQKQTLKFSLAPDEFKQLVVTLP